MNIFINLAQKDFYSLLHTINKEYLYRIKKELSFVGIYIFVQKVFYRKMNDQNQDSLKFYLTLNISFYNF